MTLFVYTNTSGDPGLRERDLIKADASGFLIDMSCVLADHCSSSTPAASRSALQQLIRRIVRQHSFPDHDTRGRTYPVQYQYRKYQ